MVEGRDSVMWRTSVSDVGNGEVRIRGYRLAEIISELSFTEAIYLVIRGEAPGVKESKAFDAVLCAILDHGFVSATIPAARYVVSGNPQAVAGLAAGVLSVGENTVSPEESARMVGEVWGAAEGGGLAGAAVEYVREQRRLGRRVPGFGHPTHKEKDPRAVAVEGVAREAGYWTPSGDVLGEIKSAIREELGIELPVNVDGACGVVLRELGFTGMEMSGVGVLSYMPGIIAHVAEELEEGVALRYIPEGKVEYSGEGPRDL